MKLSKYKVIYILTLFYIIPFSVLLVVNTLTSLFQTTYMELNLDTEKPLYKADSPLFLLLITLIFIVLCSLFLKKYTLSEKFCKMLEKSVLIYATILCFIILFLYRVRIACDSEALSNIAISFLNGDYSSFIGDNYLAHYPHQLGMIAFLETIYFLFGVENFMVLQVINVCAILSTIYFLHRITKELFDQLQLQFILSVLCIGLLPLYLYSTFIYGDIPGLGLICPCIYYIIRYLNTEKKRFILPASLYMTFSILLKSNNSIIMIAAIIILLLPIDVINNIGKMYSYGSEVYYLFI